MEVVMTMTAPVKTGVFTIDAPDAPNDPVEINPRRIFYRSDRQNRGGMKMNWIDYVVNLQARQVTVIYDNNYKVVLSGRDAKKFLSVVRDKNLASFPKDEN
jgi:hypothetical protein